MLSPDWTITPVVTGKVQIAVRETVVVGEGVGLGEGDGVGVAAGVGVGSDMGAVATAMGAAEPDMSDPHPARRARAPAQPVAMARRPCAFGMVLSSGDGGGA
jgi:hypothetical protein